MLTYDEKQDALVTEDGVVVYFWEELDGLLDKEHKSRVEVESVRSIKNGVPIVCTSTVQRVYGPQFWMFDKSTPHIDLDMVDRELLSETVIAGSECGDPVDDETWIAALKEANAKRDSVWESALDRDVHKLLNAATLLRVIQEAQDTVDAEVAVTPSA